MMELEVKVTAASVTDVVHVVTDYMDEVVSQTTLGDVITEALVDELVKDPRWAGLARRAMEKYLDRAVPAAIEGMVAAEVTRQLESAAQGAVTRGAPSTRAQAIVATEVTTQLRARFAPVVEQALGEAAAGIQVVCSACLTESCAAGNLMCDQARTAGFALRPGKNHGRSGS